MRSSGFAISGFQDSILEDEKRAPAGTSFVSERGNKQPLVNASGLVATLGCYGVENLQA